MKISPTRNVDESWAVVVSIRCSHRQREQVLLKSEQNPVTERYSQEISQGGISFNLYLRVFLIKNNQYQKAFIFWV